MRLLALRCGDLRTDAGVLFEGRPSGTKADVPIMTHAVDTGDGVLLWDTGINERCLSDLGAYLGPMMAQAFEAVGTPDTPHAGAGRAGRLHRRRHPLGRELAPPLRSLRMQPQLSGGLLGGAGAGGRVLPVEAAQPVVRARGGGPRTRAAPRASTTTASTT